MRETRGGRLRSEGLAGFGARQGREVGRRRRVHTAAPGMAQEAVRAGRRWAER